MWLCGGLRGGFSRRLRDGIEERTAPVIGYANGQFITSAHRQETAEFLPSLLDRVYETVEVEPPCLLLKQLQIQHEARIAIVLVQGKLLFWPSRLLGTWEAVP